MRRRLFDFYHRHLAWMAGAMPGGLRAAAAGGLYKVTRHPDFGFAHARHLVTHGRAAWAAALYGGPVEDALFAADLTPAPPDPDRAVATGVFLAQLGYLGLRIGGRTPAPTGGAVTLLADGVALRTERLQPGSGKYRMILSRNVLERLPVTTRLEVRLEDGRPLPVPGGGSGWDLSLPHARGGIAELIAQRGPLEKKGDLRPDAAELAARQSSYLALYTDLREVFARDFDRPLLILYGTLLGQVRAGDFIPGDDDFDVGYPTQHRDPEAAREEAIEMMIRLAELGYVIELNELGRPFRIRSGAGPDCCHLDNRPVLGPAPGTVWLHKHACLPLDLGLFLTPDPGEMRGTTVLRPSSPERFLEAYYGPGWRSPDPAYSDTGWGLPAAAREGLASLCLTPRQQRDLARCHPGRILPVRYRPLYPLAERAGRVGSISSERRSR